MDQECAFAWKDTKGRVHVSLGRVNQIEHHYTLRDRPEIQVTFLESSQYTVENEIE